MIACYQIIILTGAGLSYGLVFLLLLLRIRACSMPIPPWADALCSRRLIVDCFRRQCSRLKSELVRKLFDFSILLIVMYSGAYTGVVDLFGNKFWSGLVVFSILISFSLYLSIGVDWFIFRHHGGSSSPDPESKLRFIIQEMVSILVIEIGICIVLGCILFLENSRADTPTIVVITFSALMLYRTLLLLLQNTEKHFQEFPESGLNAELLNLLSGRGFHAERILIRSGTSTVDKYRIHQHGIIRKSLAVDRGIICSLNEAEIYTLISQWLEMRKYRIHLWKAMIRGLQGAIVMYFTTQLILRMKSFYSEGSAFQMGLRECLLLILPVALTFVFTLALQMIRNLILRRIMFAADRDIANAGNGALLISALIRTAGIERLNPDHVCEFLSSRPGFLSARIFRIKQYTQTKEGKNSDQK